MSGEDSRKPTGNWLKEKHCAQEVFFCGKASEARRMSTNDMSRCRWMCVHDCICHGFAGKQRVCMHACGHMCLWFLSVWMCSGLDTSGIMLKGWQQTSSGMLSLVLSISIYLSLGFSLIHTLSLPLSLPLCLSLYISLSFSLSLRRWITLLVKLWTWL